MLLKTLVSSVFATTALGVSIPRSDAPGMGCLNDPPSREQVAMHKQMAISEAETAIFSSPASRAVIYVDTYVHVVADSTSASSWYLSRDTINKQMSILNQYFQGTGFQYTLRDIDWTVNAQWAYDRDEFGMKKALRRGDYKTLNLYYITDIGPNHTNTGHCNYPFNADANGVINDGCVMSGWTTPGGDSPQFSTGRITVHEVGHWNNLIHTFDGNNCNGRGDYVDDTPAEASAASGCMVGRDTCPSAGVDPIHNHMDYSDDTCRTEFTPGQVARMKSSWDYYRA